MLATFAFHVRAQGRSNNAACARGVARELAASAVTLVDRDRPPCELRFVDLPVVLRAGDAAAVEQIGDHVFRSPDGRFVTYDTRGSLTLWSPTGSVIRSTGRSGQGPGEFALGPVAVHFDRQGSVYVRDNNLRWTVLSSNFEFRRTLSAAGIGYLGDHATILSDGTLLTADLPPRASTNHFHVFDLSQRDSSTGAPNLVRSFGPIDATEKKAAPSLRARLITAPVNGAFWAAASIASNRGYVLEQWSEAGKLLRTITRSTSWFAIGPVSVTAGAPPSPRLTALHDDGNGVLLVQAIRANSRWRPPSGTPAQRRAMRYDGLDVYWEAIDVRAMTVLATLGPLPAAQVVSGQPRHFPTGGRLGYRHTETAEGFDAVRITEFQLTPPRRR